MTLELHIKNECSVKVNADNTADSMHSGSLPVFASPSMVALMEQTAANSVFPFMEDGNTTVGIGLNFTHTAATPIGVTVRCESELIEIDRKRLVFKVKAYDNKELIGEGTHERFIVNAAKFMNRVSSKLN